MGERCALVESAACDSQLGDRGRKVRCCQVISYLSITCRQQPVEGDCDCEFKPGKDKGHHISVTLWHKARGVDR